MVPFLRSYYIYNIIAKCEIQELSKWSLPKNPVALEMQSLNNAF